MNVHVGAECLGQTCFQKLGSLKEQLQNEGILDSIEGVLENGKFPQILGILTVCTVNHPRVKGSKKRSVFQWRFNLISIHTCTIYSTTSRLMKYAFIRIL